MSSAGVAGPGKAFLASSLLLCAAAARAGEPRNSIEAEVTAAGSSDCGGIEGHGSTLTLSWKGPLQPLSGRPGDFHSGPGLRPSLSVTPSACGKCATMAYDTSGELRVSASFFRFPDDATKFDVSISGIVCRSTIEMGGQCRKFQEDCVLTISTYDESPLKLTRRELEGDFERHFTITGDGFVPGFDGVAHVTLRKASRCAALESMCQSARRWHKCASGSLQRLLADVAQARADVDVARRVFPHQGQEGLLPLLARFDAGLLELELRIPAWVGAASTTLSSTETTCALLPGPRDEAKCEQAARRVEEALRSAQERMGRELDERMALAGRAGQGLPDHPGVASLASLRATAAALRICRDAS